MKIKNSSALILAVTLSLSSLGVSAGQHKSDHYMMGKGEAHQGHSMSGEAHAQGAEAKHKEVVQIGGHLNKKGDQYVMHGGNGDQGHWIGKAVDKKEEIGYKMSSGDL